MSLPIDSLFAATSSMLQRLGIFDKVNQHEPKTTSGATGITAGLWMDFAGPASSGLASTSAKLIFIVRVYQNFLSEPQDAIDPKVWHAVDLILTELNGNFDMDLSEVRFVDIFGAEGDAVRAEAGYVDIDNKLHRTVTIFIPMVLNDTWVQSA